MASDRSMRRQRRHLRRIGPLGRAAAWLVAFALGMQCVIDTGAALSMWIEQGSGPMAQAPCPEHDSSGKHDRRSGHDHEQCLVCNATVANCPEPILALASATLDPAIPPPVAPERIALRKVITANAARGPPGQA
jgi:hypothetical protein